MNIFFASNLTFLIYLYSNPFRLSIKSFTSIHFTIYISYWPALLIFISHVPYIFEPSLPRQHLGNHTVGYCASYFVFFMNKYVNISTLGTLDQNGCGCAWKDEGGDDDENAKVVKR